METRSCLPRLTAGCLFSGMGGFATGLSDAGFTIRWATDCDGFACATFRHRFPGVKVVETDIRRLSVEYDKLTPVDVIAAGFPCQSFSQAGSRRGFEDPRGRLIFEIPRLLSEFTPDNRPAFVLLENVPHLLHGADGAWFDEIRRTLRRIGYWFRVESCWTVNVADYTHLPQDRERLFMVAASRSRFRKNPFMCPERDRTRTRRHYTLDELIDRTRRGSDDAYLSPENRYFKMIYRAMGTGQSKHNIYQLRRSYVREKKNGLCPTLTANMGIGGHNVPFVQDSWGIRRLSVVEVARLQGFSTSNELFPAIPDSEKYRLLGNAVCTELARLVSGTCASILRGENK